jgi:predicted enzyme related to lactoylglutathione lyase
VGVAWGRPGFKEDEMAEAKTAVASKVVWADLSSTDPAASREYYKNLFGWSVEVNPDPQYGGYALARIEDKDVAGIGGTQSPDAPSAWNVYIGTPDAADTAKKVEAAGGKVAAPPFPVGDQGTMAVFQDPTGAFISVWQPGNMAGARLLGVANTVGWAELNARGFESAIPFYKNVFGWGEKKSEAVENAPEYTEFQLDGESFAGGLEMNPMVPAEVPSYWMVYFNVDDVDDAFKKAVDTGGREMLAPSDFPGLRMAIVSDPQGAMFGLLKTKEA